MRRGVYRGGMTRLAAALSFVLGVAVAAPAGAADCVARSGPQQLPLVELYTAEGCSDCPPADRWLSELARSSAKAAALAFHVDYWDDAGWPDRFGDRRNSQRQDLRITLAGKRVTYTPQVMVGRDIHVKWRDPAQVRRLLDEAGARTAPVSLALRVEPDAGGGLAAGVEATRDAGQPPALVWLALYQDALVSQVEEGENKGRTLHHDRVVRALAGPWRMASQALSERAVVKLPADAREADMGWVLFAESAQSGEGLQALELRQAGCAGG